MKCISPLVLVLVSEDAGVPVAGPVAVVSLVVAVAGVGVAGVVTVGVAGVAGVVVAGSKQRVAIVSVATEEMLVLQDDDDIKMNILEIDAKCIMIFHLMISSDLTLTLLASATASASGAGAARATARRAEARTMKNFILIRVVVVVGCG